MMDSKQRLQNELQKRMDMHVGGAPADDCQFLLNKIPSEREIIGTAHNSEHAAKLLPMRAYL
jgi:hypothetical protein